MKPNQTRLAFIRSRTIALRFASLASLGAPIASQGVSPSVSPSVQSASPVSLASPSLPLRSVHVWRKVDKGQGMDTSEALPLGFVPCAIEEREPIVPREMLAEVEPIAYAEALPEIGAHNLAHSVNCMLLALPWRA